MRYKAKLNQDEKVTTRPLFFKTKRIWIFFILMAQQNSATKTIAKIRLQPTNLKLSAPTFGKYK